MDKFDAAELNRLMNVNEDYCVSIYIPTERAGKEVSQNPIRFKNQARRAAKQLRESGLSETDADKLMKPAYDLIESHKFWQHQSDGLAVFVAGDHFSYYRLPHRFSELTVTTGRFHIKPLLGVFGSEGRYHILALSKNRVRLFEATRDGADELELEKAPESLEDFLKYELPSKQLQFHTEGPGRGGSRDAMFYGTGDADPDVKDAILRYFQAVDKSVRGRIREDSAPLVLAAVGYLIPIYKKAGKHANIIDQSVKGNPDELSARELNRKAWEIVKDRFAQDRAKASEKYLAMAENGGKTADSIEKVVPAAWHGQVDTLFVPVGAQVWGRFNPDTNEVVMHEKEQPGDQDLLDLAAVRCFAGKGRVYAVPPEDMPADAQAAAILRY